MVLKNKDLKIREYDISIPEVKFCKKATHVFKNYRELFLDPLHFPRYKIPLYSMAFRENFGAVMGGFRKKHLVVGVELFVADPS